MSRHPLQDVIDDAKYVAILAGHIGKQAQVIESYARDGQCDEAERAFAKLDANVTRLWNARTQLANAIQRALVERAGSK